MTKNMWRPAARLMAAFWMSWAAAAAEPQAAPDAAACSGIDMFAAAKTTDPDLFASVSAEAKKVENTEAILWKVEKPGVPPSHLFGTIHITDPRVTTMPAPAKAALDTAKTVALEFVGGEEAAGKSMLEGAGDLIAYKDGRTLDTQLTPEEFAHVKALIEKTGMPGEIAQLIRPWFISVMLAISECERKKIDAGAKALDTLIESIAQGHGAKMVGLETPQSQVQAMTSVPEDEQVQMLKAELKYADRTNDTLETLVQMYLKRNIGAAMPFNMALAAKHGIAPAAFDGFIKILLNDRNAKMRDAASPLFDQGNAFVAVGAMHLVGAQGLVKLLRDKGYSVTPVE